MAHCHSKPHLDCVCKFHRPECDCVSDDFKRHTIKMREHAQAETRDTTIAWIVVFMIIGVTLGFWAGH